MKTIFKIELALVVVSVLLLALLFAPSTKDLTSITGFVSTEVHRQPLSINIDKSQVLQLETSESIYLNHLSISGQVRGDKAVYVYLDNGVGLRSLVYTNVHGTDFRKGLTSITGMVVGDTSEKSKSGENSENGESLTLTVKTGPALTNYISLKAGESATDGAFKDACIESCVLESEQFNSDKFELVILVEPGAELDITGLTFVSLTP